jgi:hypothetical protein
LEKRVADHITMIFFRTGGGDLDTTATVLAGRGMSVRRESQPYGDELTVGYPDGPQLRVAFSREPHVREEAKEIGDGSPHAVGMSSCDARYEILIDDLDGVLDEINTLIEVQLTLQHATGGFTFHSWNGRLDGPEKINSDQVEDKPS